MGRKIEDLEGCLEEEEDRWLKDELDVLASECEVRRKAVRKERDKRRELRRKMEGQTFEANLPIRVDPKTEKVIEEKAEARGVAKTEMVRESFHKGIRKREKFDSLIAWMESWEEELESLSEGEKEGERLRSDVEILIERIRERRVEGR
jgi:hypothetical protein